MCKIKGVILIGVWMLRTPVSVSIVWTTFTKHLALLNGMFPIKMAPVHEVWSWSLGEQRVILTEVLMFRKPVFVVWTTFAKNLALLTVIFPIKMTPVHEVWSWSLGQGPETPRTLSYTLGDQNRVSQVLLALTFDFWTSDLGLTIEE